MHYNFFQGFRIRKCKLNKFKTEQFISYNLLVLIGIYIGIIDNIVIYYINYLFMILLPIIDRLGIVVFVLFTKSDNE